MLFLPFESLPETKFVAIDGLHLLQQLGVSPDEDPDESQKQIRNQAQYLLIMENAAVRLSERSGCSLDAARKEVFAAASQQEPEGEEGGEEGKEKEAVPRFYQYFSADEVSELMIVNSAAADRRSKEVRAATYFIRNRIAYPVRVAVISEASTKPCELPIAKLAYPIADKQKIRISEDCVLQIQGYHPVGSTKLKVYSVPRPLEAGTIGYLLDGETGDYRLGNADWTEEHTCNTRYLKQETVSKIYQFYLAEKAGVENWETFNLLALEAEEEEPEDSEEAAKNELSSSDESPEPSRSTGDESTGLFSTTDVPTRGSRRRASVASQAG